ncbi:MAG: gliding motility lipoprotein GldH [Bacteroidaceae bacterium]|jgi:gliding motility-associated lipoprotein GldH|nr:gliding motility lipoprotein GldH [Bacteroidaceae bacterium]MBQ1676925.1 gliding motility lipoprotein GldH [Bacteroidaceae bacterium]MBQ2054954.1 gliding motility lipoprotein GldH [Bacteroidaceae bacterium]MBQ3875750.1 gliding motility lipoprotein GldH [Bacteroidaceae bacterium]MBQ5478017.1 gliding motility lipoprotein GldH [Bacteroidaceae bacterium]
MATEIMMRTETITRLLSSSLLAACLIILFSACSDDKTLLHSFHSIENSKWEKDDTAKFTLPAVWTDRKVEVQVEVRTNSRYPYQTLWLKAEHNFADSTKYVKQSVKCTILNETGDIQGNGISTVQYAYPIGTFNIKKGQESTIKITHNMRSELLNGIHDIGVKIVEAE